MHRIYLLVEAFGRKKFWICLNRRYPTLFQSRAWSVAQPSFRESGATVADDVYPGTKHNGASDSSLIVQVLFQNHFFFVTGVGVEFRFERIRNQLRSSTFENCELTAQSFESNLQYFKRRRRRLLCGRAAGMERQIRSVGAGKRKAGKKTQGLLCMDGKFVTCTQGSHACL